MSELTITLNEKDAFRRILTVAEDDEKIPKVSYPGIEFQPDSNTAYIDFSRTNIYSSELLGNQNSYKRFRNSFFITLEVNVPLAWGQQASGRDPETETEKIIAELFKLFQPRSFIPITDAEGYISHGIKIDEAESEDEKTFGSRAQLESDEAQDIYYRMYLRLNCEHIYLLPR